MKYRTTKQSFLFSVCVCALGATFGCQGETNEGRLPADENAIMRESIEAHRQDALVTVTLDNVGDGTTVPCNPVQDWDDLYPEESGREFENGILRERVVSNEFAPDEVEGSISYVLVTESKRGVIGRGGPLNLWAIPWGGTVDVLCAGEAVPTRDFWMVTGAVPPDFGSIPIEEIRATSADNLAEYGLRSASDFQLSYDEVPLPPGPMD